jgi:extracellular elastinolytic metalloproteinase
VRTGERPADTCPGNRRWIQIVFDAMVLMPTAPSMLQARDAYLAADMMRFGGANQNELWLAFARRGFGLNATSSNATSNQNDSDPKPDFESPNHGRATVTFNTVAGSSPVRARIFVGHYEARVSPIADTDPTTGPTTTVAPGASNLDNRANFAPGTYEFVAQARGHGHVRFRQAITAGTRTITINMPANHASQSNGATAAGDGENHQDLIDDTEGTNWDDPSGGGPVNETQPQVTVKLAGPRTINRAQVSAALLSQNRFTAVRQFRLETSTNNGATFQP